MRALRSTVALACTVAVMACQTASAVSVGRAGSPAELALRANSDSHDASFMTAGNTAGIVRPSQAVAVREINRRNTASAAATSGRKTLLVVAIIAAVIVVAVLVADGDGSGY